MAKGTKLSLEIGAAWDEGWSLQDDNAAPAMKTLLPSEHRLVFQREKRKGKPVSLVGPFSLDEQEGQKYLSSLKKSLACGGAFKDGWMEFQGDIAPRIRELLEQAGFRFKK